MGKNKLKKFAEMKHFRCVVEAPGQMIKDIDHELKGNWNEMHFHSDSPLVLELGCGKGEYTVGLARRNPDKNFLGIDIKGARIYTGAKTVEEEHIPNAGFLRTQIESLPRFFAPGEVSELWITFPDPQLKKTNKRLTSTRFLNYYRNFMPETGIVYLKTDSPFLFEYTRRLVKENKLDLIFLTEDLYSIEKPMLEKDIKTFYEQQWLSRGKTIKLLKFRLGSSTLKEPDVADLIPDDYHAAARFNRSSD